jgi:flagellar biosynthesis component FlhA
MTITTSKQTERRLEHDRRQRRMDSLAMIGGAIMVVDTIWGGLAALGLDLRQMNELVLGISFVLGLPLFLLDFWMKKRIAFSLLALFFFRWAALCFAGPTPVLVAPWRGSVLLIVAFVLLQLYKGAPS